MEQFIVNEMKQEQQAQQTPFADQAVLFPQPKPETVEMKRTYNRAGFSVAALYGTIAQGETVAILLMICIAVVFAIGGAFSSIDLPDTVRLGGSSILDMIDSLIGTGMIATMLTVFLAVQAMFWIVGYVMMRLVLPKGTPIEKKTLSFGRFLMIALMCFGVWGVGAALGNLSSFFAPELAGLDLGSFGVESIPYLIYAVIGAPIVEELTFRKALLDRLHDTHEGYAAVVSGLLFGLMHGNHKQFFLAFFLGMLFAMVYQRTGRVVYTMLLHGMINFTATLPSLLALFDIDIETGWYIAVGTLMIAGLIVLLVRRRDPLLQVNACSVSDANSAVYRNIGMNIVRIVALVMIGVQGMILIVSSMAASDRSIWWAYLLDLIPLSLVFVTVLLLPKFTKRYEAKPTEEKPA